MREDCPSAPTNVGGEVAPPARCRTGSAAVSFTAEERSDDVRCPHRGTEFPAFRAMREAVLAISEGELAVDPILQRLVEAARGLVGARYAAIGVPDREGGFAKLIAAAMTEAQWEALGGLPRTHILLRARGRTHRRPRRQRRTCGSGRALALGRGRAVRAPRRG